MDDKWQGRNEVYGIRLSTGTEYTWRLLDRFLKKSTFQRVFFHGEAKEEKR